MNNLREKARELAGLIWANADLLRGHYKRADYGKIILPFTVIRRLDIILEPTKPKVLTTFQKHKNKKPEVLEPILNSAAGKGMQFHNRSQFTFNDLAKDTQSIAANFRNYLLYGDFPIRSRKLSTILVSMSKSKNLMNMICFF